MPETTVVHRTAVRLIVVDEQDDVLLLHYQTPDTGEDFWCTPGGAIDEDETHADAARRELLEETGWTGHLDIGAAVWTREHEFRVGDGRLFRQHELYHLVALPHFVPRATALSGFESQAVVEMRWWSLAELMRATSALQPPQLAKLVHRLLHDRTAESV